jgi:hypothetical protein
MQRVFQKVKTEKARDTRSLHLVDSICAVSLKKEFYPSRNIGNEKFNQRLSVKRAQTIKDFLVNKGIDVQRIEMEGKGCQYP